MKIKCYLLLISSYQIFTSLDKEKDLLRVLYSHQVAMNMNMHSSTKEYKNRKKDNRKKTHYYQYLNNEAALSSSVYQFIHMG